jgi:putative CocE/NonD family hydrolase
MFPGQDPADLEIVTDFPHEVVEEPTVWIPLSDGLRLAARIWRPAGSDEAAVPAVLEYIPYRRRDGRLADDERIHPYFAGHGFASLRVDIRGTGDSEGLIRDEYLPLEQDDAVEVIDWIAAQPWCSGAVGMMGLSWGGFNSLQVAARAPAPLKAIIAVGATVDRYNDDIHYKNGCLLNENFGWGSSFFSFSTRPPDPEVVGEAWRAMWLERLENLTFYPENWLAHQARDAYWKHGSVCEDYGAIQCPVMIVTGWGDLYVNAVPRLLENLEVPCRGLAGAWAHQFPHLATPGPGADFLGDARRWWEHWLKGEDNGIDREPVHRAYCQEGQAPDPFAARVPGRWIAAEAWPAAETREEVLHLGPAGLTREAVPAPQASVRSPLDTGLSASELVPHCLGPEMALDQRPDDGGSLVFDTPPLEEALDIWGDPVVELTLSSDRASGNLVLRLCDVGPDGASERVTYGLLNLAHRNGNEDPAPVPPGEPVALRVRLDHVAHRFPPGHRLRLALATANWPQVWPAPDDPTLTLAPQPARLVLPVWSGGEGETRWTPEGPKAPPAANIRSLRAPASDRRAVLDQAARTTAVEILDDYGELVFADNGMMNSGIKRETHRIAWDDPLSATADFHWTQELGRGPWRVRTETTTHLACDASDFHLSARVVAYEGDETVFEKTWATSIPRLPKAPG